ncbi:MAG: energy transducer TonB [Rhodopirellula sp.]|nr:energy transducer TonB [Rhodopirellula sp.]
MTLCALLLSIARLANAADGLPPGEPLLARDSTTAAHIRVRSDLAASQWIPVAGQTFSKAVRVETKKRPAHPYEIQICFPTIAAVAKGDVLLASFFARATSTPPGTSEATVATVFERAGPPYEKSLQVTLSVTQQWQPFQLPFRAEQSLEAGQGQLSFQLGYDPQCVEIGRVELTSYGRQMDIHALPATQLGYRGREADAPWRRAAAERIERYRKGPIKVTVLDAEGRPVEDADVRVTMTQHAFGWGSAVTADLLTADTADSRKYRETVRKLYNKVVFENDLKWPTWQREGNRPAVFTAIRWLEESGIGVRGHCLVWPSWRRMPRDVQRLADESAALRKRVNEHITEEVTALRGKLVEWDVINEPYTNHDAMDVLGRSAMVEWFRLAHEADAGVQLYVNDYAILAAGGRDRAHQDHYEQTIRYLLDQGAPLQGIGLQGHFGSDLTPPERLIEILDRFAKFGIPLQVTEHDIDVTDEQLQADYTRDFLTAMFGHPAVKGLLTWGFWEGRHWRPNGAYFRRDWSIKPAGQAWLDLVLNAWWTRFSGSTDDTGKVATRGFLGEYEIVATKGGARQTEKVTLSTGGAKVTIKLLQ